MKLFSDCNKKNSLFNLNSSIGVNFKDYSMDDFNRFMETAKKHYVKRLFSWYETDMSDSDSGNIFDYFSINHTNMIIKDNDLYGVLVKTRGMFPLYYLLNFKTKHTQAALGGGYNSLDYDWWIMDNDLNNLDTLNVASNYVLLYEKISYNKDKLSFYSRDVISFLQQDCIIENNAIVGLKYEDDNLFEFKFLDKNSLIKKIVKEDGNHKSITNMKLVQINKEFLDMNIFDVTYEDFKKGNFKLLDI